MPPLAAPAQETSASVTPGRSRPSLLGRDAEAELLAAVVDHLHERGGALVVCGEAGIGKSALLQQARERASASGARTLGTAGVESEAELAFAGLHQLLRPILELTEFLADPQRRALQAAFGLIGDAEPDPFHVALAAQQLVSEAAKSSPLVLIVDDAHWLDRSSLGVLTFHRSSSGD
jgi:predicted ATPase